ncbi:transcriptional regulator GcvA [Trinickia fusca]|uniref:Transcriptional regulator GcvA n=2 Tax=Trinickia fusca TaxID=2419777 RepID=A0A494XFC4_9BURK|nr:transcriptional regulator GcvA [Trinickia fusca]RKP49497.1 transcriptional regulator GcvA [Trinickia fusca]
MRRLPPLSALRAFEAAARQLSFTQAAAELCVTQAAISHQVRQLEDWLGFRLFERRGHALSLTDKGRIYLAELTPAFDLLARATMRVREKEDGPLRITALPSFASRWLVPRLHGFQAQHPDIELKLTSSAELWNGMDDRFDVAIRSGIGRWPGMKSELIAREMLSPVCAPQVAAGPPALRCPDDLRYARLLHDTPKHGWKTWSEQAGVPGLDGKTGLAFDDAALALQAAVQGQGVALGRLMLAADDLRSGLLVQPFDLAIANDYSYWLIYPSAKAERPDVAAFRLWLLGQAREARRHLPAA